MTVVPLKSVLVYMWAVLALNTWVGGDQPWWKAILLATCATGLAGWYWYATWSHMRVVKIERSGVEKR